MTLPLDSIKVLDLTRLLPGAVCTMMLADMGADVIKVESPDGGDYARYMGKQINGQGVFFRMNNRNKRSIILNLKDEQGQAILKHLVKSADVLVEGFRPDVMTRLNCDYESLKAINPKLVYCSLSGWGMDGPYSMKSGHDLNYIAEAGLLSPMEQPQVLGGQIADIGSAYVGVSGILAALFRRERTGEGGHIDVSLSEAALPFALLPWAEALTQPTQSGQGMITGELACYYVYQTKDEQYVSLGALEPKFWINFCNAIKRPDLIEKQHITNEQKSLKKDVQAIFSTKTMQEWAELLDDVDCCFSVVKSLDTIHHSPQYQEREALGTFDDGTPWMRSPIRLSESNPDIQNIVPAYGEHTREVLLQAGYTNEEIASFLKNGLVK